MTQEFISEDDLKTFEGWLRYQCVDAAAAAPEELAKWQQCFDEARTRCAASPEVGLMKLQPVSGEHRYAVAVREGSNLWLVLWVRLSRKGEFFVMVPRADRDWDVHTSYHLDGSLHMKSHDRKIFPANKRQPLGGAFQGAESLATFGGYGPKDVGAICDPAAFSGVVEVAPGVLGPRHGVVTVDLIQPGCDPTAFGWTQIIREDFHDAIPWVVIRVWATNTASPGVERA